MFSSALCSRIYYMHFVYLGTRPKFTTTRRRIQNYRLVYFNPYVFIQSAVVYASRFWSELLQALHEFNLHLNKILTCYSCFQTVQLYYSLSNLLTTFILSRLCPEFVWWATHICKMCLRFVYIYFWQIFLIRPTGVLFVITVIKLLK
jgi:hypothetical protein